MESGGDLYPDSVTVRLVRPDPPPTPEERIAILEKRVADLERLTEGLLKEHHRWRQWMKAWPR